MYGGSPETVHARTVLTNPEAVMHQPDPWRAVIVEGRVDHIELDADAAKQMADRASAKYPEYGQQPSEHYDSAQPATPADPRLDVVPRRLHPVRVPVMPTRSAELAA